MNWFKIIYFQTIIFVTDLNICYIFNQINILFWFSKIVLLLNILSDFQYKN